MYLLSDCAKTKFNCLSLAITHIQFRASYDVLGASYPKFVLTSVSFIPSRSKLVWHSTPLNCLLISTPCSGVFTYLKLALNSFTYLIHGFKYLFIDLF
ncbi:hypothetical protein HanOQP8_Chr11g0396201 [Helianthus annuus]|nr:hypothetical protein HanOQP8_Chr11g0396201 [Helianthus annuus]